MRSKLFLVGVTFALGCGGGSKGKVTIVDAAIDSPTIDAAPTCAVSCDNPNFCTGANLNSPNFPALRLGQPQGMGNGPASGDWFITFTQGDLNGRKAFDIFASTSPMGANPLDVLGIRLLRPVPPANFPLNAPQTFEPNPNVAVPNAWSFWLGDAAIDTGTGQILDVAMEYWGTMGSITLTAIGEADGANITGSTAPITWQQIDDMGMVVSGGCTSTMGMGAATGFTFNLVQMAAPFQSQGSVDLGNGYRTLTAEETAAVKAYLAKRGPQVTGQQL